MEFNLYKDVKKMYLDTYDILLQDEVLNAILLGNLIIGNDGIDKDGWKDPKNWFMATVTNNSKIILIALMTPPHNLTLYAVEENNDSLDCLINGIINNNIYLPGIMCEEKLAMAFANKYTDKTNCTFSINRNQGIYELEKVNSNIPIIGVIRPFKKSDSSFIPYWIEEVSSLFNDTPIYEVSDDLNRYSQTKGLYVLEDDGVCVSMARISRPMKTCCCVSMVYTPPFFRNHGYASSSVAQVSQIILDQGFSKCVLYTDLDYPTSNSIYKKIGYRHVINSLEISFNSKQG